MSDEQVVSGHDRAIRGAGLLIEFFQETREVVEFVEGGATPGAASAPDPSGARPTEQEIDRGSLAPPEIPG